MAFPFILLAAVLFGLVGLMLLMPKPKVENARPDTLDKLNFPTASEGSPIPLILGTIRHRGPNTLWYGDFQSVAIKKKVKTGLFSSKKVTTGYKYYVGIDLGLGLGPGVTLTKIWFDKDEVWSGAVGPAETSLSINKPSLWGGEEKGGGFVGTLRFYGGNLSQPVNAYVAGKVTNGLPAYVGQSHLVLEHCYIGTSAQLRTMSFELGRLTNAIGLPAGHHAIGVDMNPAEMLYQILTLDWGGLDVDPNDINLPSFVACGETLFTESNGMSLIISSPNAGKDAIEEVLRQIDGIMYQDPVTGKIILALIREDYDIETLPVLDKSNVASVRSFSRTSWDDTVNQVRVTYANRSNKYEKGSAIVQDLANINSQGRIRSVNFSFPGVTNGDLASRLASREMAQTSVPLFRATLEVNRLAASLRPGQAFIWAWDEYQIEQVVMRVQRFSLGDLVDGRIVIDCVQDRFALDSTIFAPPEGTSHTPIDQSALPITKAAVIEVPYWLMQQQQDIVPLPPAAGNTYVLTMARSPGQYQQGYTSTIEQGTEAILAADHTLYSDTALLVAPIAATDGFVAGSLPAFNISAPSDSGTWLAAATTAATKNGSNLFLLGSELMTFETLVNVGGGVFTIGNVRRALIDTSYQAHAAGDALFFLSVDGLSEAQFAGTVAMNGKLQSFTDRDETDYALANVFPLVPNRRYERPLPPDNLQVNGVRALNPSIDTGTALSVAWSARSRLVNSILSETDAASASEAGTTFILRWYLDNVLKGTVNPATTPTVINPGPTDVGAIRIEVTAVLGGLESYTPGIYLINSTAPAPPAPGPALYWRVLHTSPSGAFVAWSEVEWLDVPGGADLTALGGTAIQDSNFPGLPAASAYDNNIGTLWACNGTGAASWIGWQFLTPQEPSALSLTTRNDGSWGQNATGFAVQKSPDGITWSTVWVEAAVAWSGAGQKQTFVANNAKAFGYVAGEGTADAQVQWNGEHEGSSYINTSGGAILVNTILLRRVTAGATVSMQLGLYADTGADAPGALLGSTNVVVLANGNNLFTMTAPVNVPNGTKVWVIGKANGAVFSVNGLRATADRFDYKTLPYATAFTNPFGAATTFARILPVTLSA